MSKVENFHMRPVTVEAMKVYPLDTATAEKVRAWCPNAYVDPKTNHLVLAGAAGNVSVNQHDWIVKHEGSFYIADDLTFHSKYVAIDEGVRE